MKIDEALDILQQHGLEANRLDETTAMTAPEYIFGSRIYKALRDYINDIKEDAEEDAGEDDYERTKVAASRMITCIEKALADDKLMEEAVNAFLDKIGFNEAFDKAWEEYHGRLK